MESLAGKVNQLDMTPFLLKLVNCPPNGSQKIIDSKVPARKGPICDHSQEGGGLFYFRSLHPVC